MKAGSKRRNNVALGVLAVVISQAVHAADESVQQLQEVTVTSTTIDDRFEEKRGEVSRISSISGKKVDDEHGKNIVEVLESIPGVTAEVQSGDSVKIMFRGIEAQRYMGEKPGVAIIIDGVPVFERTGRVNIDLDNIDSIKVIKGGASYLYGEDALSGAVIITTKRGARMAGGMVSAEKGSFNYRKLLGRAGFANESWMGHIQMSEIQSDDFYDQGAYARAYVDGKLQYMLDESSDISFGFENARREKDSHGTVTGVTNALLDPRSATSGGKDFARMYDVGLDKINLTYNRALANRGDLLLTAYQYKDHTVYKSNPRGYLRDAGGAFLYGTSTASNMSNFKDAYASLNDQHQVQRGIKGEWRMGGEQTAYMAGVDIRRDEDHQRATNLVTYTSSPSAINPATNPLNLAGSVTGDNIVHTRTDAAYGEFTWQVTRPLSTTLNLRHDDITVDYGNNLLLAGTGKINSAQRRFNVLSERAGLNYALSDSAELYAVVSSGFRIPTAAQLYGSTISPTGTVLANPGLRPEKAWNQELGYRAKHTWLGMDTGTDMSIFQIERTDFILNTGGQYQTTPTGQGVEQYQNIGGVRNRGMELSVKTDATRTFAIDLAYTYLNAVFTRNDTYWMKMGPVTAPFYVLYNNTGKTVPRSPRHKLNLAATYRPATPLTLTAEINVQSGIWADEVNVVWVGGRSVLNLMAKYEHDSTGKFRWSAFARVDNTFDRYYYTTIRGSSDSNGDGVYNAEDPSISVNPGRVWTAGLSATF